ncbi:MAG: hypothetical protein ACFB6S_05430 [Geminicoccaceae bacterium]
MKMAKVNSASPLRIIMRISAATGIALASMMALKSAVADELVISAAKQSGPVACAKHEQLSQLLNKRFSEQAVETGLSERGRLIQLFSSEGGDTWTLVATAPDGTSCIVASGRYWHERDLPTDGPVA